MAAPEGFRLADVDWHEEAAYRERRGGDWDTPLPARLRCLACGWKGWGASAAGRHRKRCAGPVPDAPLEAFPAGRPVWVDI